MIRQFFQSQWFDYFSVGFLAVAAVTLLSTLASAISYRWRWLKCRKGTVQFISPDGKRHTSKRITQAAIFRLMDDIEDGKIR